MKSLALILSLLGIIAPLAAIAAPTAKADKVKVRPATSDCAKDDYECRLGVVRKTNARQDLNLKKLGNRLKGLATVRARQNALETYVQMLPQRLRAEAQVEIDELKKHIEARLAEWDERCADFQFALNRRINALEDRVDTIDERVTKLEQDDWLFLGAGEFRNIGGASWGISAGFGYHWGMVVPLQFRAEFGGLWHENANDVLGTYSLSVGIVPEIAPGLNAAVFGEYFAAGGADGPKQLAQQMLRGELQIGSQEVAFAPSCGLGHGEYALPGHGSGDGFTWGCNAAVIYRR